LSVCFHLVGLWNETFSHTLLAVYYPLSYLSIRYYYHLPTEQKKKKKKKKTTTTTTTTTIVMSSRRRSTRRRTPRKLQSPSPSSSDNEPEQTTGEAYEVEEILDKRRHLGRVQYLIKWAGYSVDQNEWVNASDIMDKAMVRLFNERLREASQPSTPRSTRATPRRSSRRSSSKRTREVTPTSTLSPRVTRSGRKIGATRSRTQHDEVEDDGSQSDSDNSGSEQQQQQQDDSVPQFDADALSGDNSGDDSSDEQSQDEAQTGSSSAKTNWEPIALVSVVFWLLLSIQVFILVNGHASSNACRKGIWGFIPRAAEPLPLSIIAAFSLLMYASTSLVIRSWIRSANDATKQEAADRLCQNGLRIVFSLVLSTSTTLLRYDDSSKGMWAVVLTQVFAFVSQEVAVFHAGMQPWWLGMLLVDVCMTSTMFCPFISVSAGRLGEFISYAVELRIVAQLLASTANLLAGNKQVASLINNCNLLLQTIGSAALGYLAYGSIDSIVNGSIINAYLVVSTIAQIVDYMGSK
jgi:Chromo (CHRromatin Organisation MOdifier) domain